MASLLQTALELCNNLLADCLNISVVRPWPRKAVRFAARHFAGRRISCVEVGVFEGQNAKSMTRALNIDVLWLIDPYEYYGGYSDYKNAEVKVSDRLQRAEKAARWRLRRCQAVCRWIKAQSDAAISEISAPVHFIYIDGNHSYEYVKADIARYFEILEAGGILAGHDVWHPDVGRAVTEFVSSKKLHPHFDTSDWWFVKS